MRYDINKSELAEKNWIAVATIENLESVGWDFSADRESMDEVGSYSKEHQNELNVRIVYNCATGKTYSNIEPEGSQFETGADAKDIINDVFSLMENAGLVDFEFLGEE